VTDFDFEVRTKKQLARSAKYKVNGSKSRKCTLATDYMTPSQIRKMNGETISYNINKPMTLEEFQKVPPASGREYILHLVDIYGVKYSNLAEMFGCCRKKCSEILSAPPYEIQFGRGCTMSKQKREQWNLFIGKEDDREIIDVPTPNSAENTCESITFSVNDAKPQPEPAAMKMDEFSLNFSGYLTAEAIANSLRLILGDGMNGRLSIKCYLGGDSNEQQ